MFKLRTGRDVREVIKGHEGSVVLWMPQKKNAKCFHREQYSEMENFNHLCRTWIIPLNISKTSELTKHFLKCECIWPCVLGKITETADVVLEGLRPEIQSTDQLDDLELLKTFWACFFKWKMRGLEQICFFQMVVTFTWEFAKNTNFWPLL